MLLLVILGGQGLSSTSMPVLCCGLHCLLLEFFVSQTLATESHCEPVTEYYDDVMSMCMSCQELCLRGRKAQKMCLDLCGDYYLQFHLGELLPKKLMKTTIPPIEAAVKKQKVVEITLMVIIGISCLVLCGSAICIYCNRKKWFRSEKKTKRDNPEKAPSWRNLMVIFNKTSFKQKSERRNESEEVTNEATAIIEQSLIVVESFPYNNHVTLADLYENHNHPQPIQVSEHVEHNLALEIPDEIAISQPSSQHSQATVEVDEDGHGEVDEEDLPSVNEPLLHSPTVPKEVDDSNFSHVPQVKVERNKTNEYQAMETNISLRTSDNRNSLVEDDETPLKQCSTICIEPPCEIQLPPPSVVSTVASLPHKPVRLKPNRHLSNVSNDSGIQTDAKPGLTQKQKDDEDATNQGSTNEVSDTSPLNDSLHVQERHNHEALDLCEDALNGGSHASSQNSEKGSVDSGASSLPRQDENDTVQEPSDDINLENSSTSAGPSSTMTENGQPVCRESHNPESTASNHLAPTGNLSLKCSMPKRDIGNYEITGVGHTPNEDMNDTGYQKCETLCSIDLRLQDAQEEGTELKLIVNEEADSSITDINTEKISNCDSDNLNT